MKAVVCTLVFQDCHSPRISPSKQEGQSTECLSRSFHYEWTYFLCEAMQGTFVDLVLALVAELRVELSGGSLSLINPFLFEVRRGTDVCGIRRWMLRQCDGSS